MKTLLKKIIAREFLFLLFSTIFFFLSLFLWTVLNEKNKGKEEKIINNITELYFKDTIPYLLKQYVNTSNDIEYKSNWKIINSKFPELQKYNPDILQEYVATANNNKYDGWLAINSKFPEFGFDSNGLFKKSKNYNKIIYNKDQLNKVKNSFFNNNVDEESLFLFFVITCFGIRYLIYMTKWSFEQLK